MKAANLSGWASKARAFERRIHGRTSQVRLIKVDDETILRATRLTAYPERVLMKSPSWSGYEKPADYPPCAETVRAAHLKGSISSKNPAFALTNNIYPLSDRPRLAQRKSWVRLPEC